MRMESRFLANMCSSHTITSLAKEVLAELPDSSIRHVPDDRDPEGLPTTVWTHPAPSAYGSDCFAIWTSFGMALRRAWGADSAYYLDARFRITSKQPIGILTTRADGRHLLNGEPVHCGDTLQILVWDQNWLTVRFELAHTAGGKVPMAHLGLSHTEAAFPITDAMIVRPYPFSR